MRNSRVASLLLSATLVMSAHGAGWQAVLKAVADHAPSSLAFEEEMHAFYLEQPAVSRGTLERLPNGDLVKRIVKPEPAVIRLGRGRIQVTRDGQPAAPEAPAPAAARLLADALVAVFVGDVEHVAAIFDVRLGSEKAGMWTLTLVPRDGRLKEWVRELRLTGEGHQLRAFRLTQPNGDFIHTRLTPQPGTRPR